MSVDRLKIAPDPLDLSFTCQTPVANAVAGAASETDAAGEDAEVAAEADAAAEVVDLGVPDTLRRSSRTSRPPVRFGEA